MISMTSAGQAKMKNKKTTVYEKIKKRIINGSVAPGFPINEYEFAQNLNVSKTPVREALSQLAREGFVENIPGRGSGVTHITFQDIREIFELREIIECGVVKRVALVRDEKDVLTKKNELEQLFEKGIKAKVSIWGPEEDIHQFIVKCVGNRKLHETYLGLLDHIIRIRKHFGRRFTRQRFENMITEHIEILDAVIERNSERAELAVQKHLRNAAAYLLGLYSPNKG